MLTRHTSNRPRRDHANSNGRLASGTGNYLLQRCATEAVGGRGAEAVEAPGHIHHRRCSSSGGFIKDCLTSPQQIDSNTCSPVLGHKNHSRWVFIVSFLLFSNTRHHLFWVKETALRRVINFTFVLIKAVEGLGTI